MARLAKLGLEVQITEMDVRIREPIQADDLIQQAQIYGNILGVCLEAPNCSTLVMWGLSDQQSWIPHVYPEWGSALIFADLDTPKPAYFEMIKALQEQKADPNT